MDYLSRMLEYSDLLRELEIGGEEHLKVILKDSATYLKRVEEAQTTISSDKFLSAEDKETMLRKINSYAENVKQKSDDKKNGDDLYSLALLAMAVIYMLKQSEDKEFTADSFYAFKDELEKIFSNKKS